MNRLIGFGLVACVCACAQAAFEQLDYVESTGAQWINTRYVPAATDTFEMKVRFADAITNATHALWCARGASTQTGTMTAFAMKPSRLRVDRNTSTDVYSADSALAAGVDHVIVANYATRAVTLDGAAAATMADGDFTPGGRLTLLASQLAEKDLGNFATCRLMAFKIVNASGALVRDFVPARDTTTGEAGLFERVNKVFYAGRGATRLTAGAVTEGGETWTAEEFLDGAVVNVPEGEEKTLTADEVTAFGAKTLVKTGAGTLVAGEEMAAFTGDILIREGCYKVTHTSALGTTNGCTIVSGGTLWSTLASGNDGTGVPSCGSDRLFLRGEGSGRKGVVYQTNGTAQTLCGKNGVFFEGPCRFGGSASFEFRYGAVYANNCPVTVAMNKARSFRFVALALSGEAAVTVESGTFGVEGMSFGKPITAQNDTEFSIGNVNTIFSPISFGAGARFAHNWSSEQIGPKAWLSKDVLSGPLTLTDDLSVYMNSRGRAVDLRGTVTGAGGLRVKGAGGYVQFYSPENSFTGGVSVKGVVGSGDLAVTGGVVVVARGEARATATGTIPVDGGAIALTNAQFVTFDDRALAFPDLSVDGKGVVTGFVGKSTFKSLTKTGTGPLTVFGPVQILGDTEIAGGTLRFGTRVSPEGLMWSHVHGNKGDVGAINVPTSVPRMGVDRQGPSYAYQGWRTTSGANNASDHNQCHYYEGWMKVPGEEGDEVACNFLTCINRGVFIAIDGVVVARVNDNKDLMTGKENGYKRCVVAPRQTLTAGWHKLLVYMGNWYDGYSGPRDQSFTQADGTKVTWPKNFGLAVDWQGRCSSNTTDYVKLVDPGDGSFLRTYLTDAEKATVDPADYRPTFAGAVAFGPGAALDVNDTAPFTPVVVSSLTGVPTIKNGAVTVTGTTWTLRASDFADGAVPLTLEGGATLAFAEGTRFAFEGDFDELAHTGALQVRPLVRAAAVGAIANLPTARTRVGDTGWYVMKSEDGTGLELRRFRGFALYLR